MRLTYSLLLPLVFISCAGSGFTTRDHVSVVDDSYSENETYMGVTKSTNAKSITDNSFNYFLRSWKSKSTGGVTHQAYIETYYTGDWRFYDKATFEGGEEADVVVINRSVETCSVICAYHEVLGVDIPSQKLIGSKDGISFKLYAESGHSFIVRLSKEQIASQLSAIKQ